jgi:hypothetical protein
MSYYILPKNNNIINFNSIIETNDIKPFVSFTFYKYLNEVQKQLNNLCKENSIYFDNILKIINPYEYIFTKVPGTKYSVSKLKPDNIIFFNLMEIYCLLNLFDIFENTDIKSIHYGENSSSSIDCLNILREDNNDMNIGINNFNYSEKEKEIDSSIEKNSIHFLFYDIIDNLNFNDYVISLLEIINNIFFYQGENGISIIKINDLFYKPIIDILYIFCNMYEKVYIIKPNTTNILLNDKFIVCKKFILNDVKIREYNNYKEEIKKIIINYNRNTKIDDNNTITSLINNDYQYFFINKLEEFNIITGQQQIESYDQIINILKSKNREDKLEILKKNNIQKSIQWCEKYRIPYNKFSEMFNIFLPIKNETNNENYDTIYNNSLDIIETNTINDSDIIHNYNDIDDINDTDTDIISNIMNDILINIRI